MVYSRQDTADGAILASKDKASKQGRPSMLIAVLIPETVYERQPVKDCHGETRMEELPRVVWRGKNIVITPPVIMLQHSPHNPSRLLSV